MSEGTAGYIVRYAAIDDFVKRAVLIKRGLLNRVDDGATLYASIAGRGMEMEIIYAASKLFTSECRRETKVSARSMRNDRLNFNVFKPRTTIQLASFYTVKLLLCQSFLQKMFCASYDTRYFRLFSLSKIVTI